MQATARLLKRIHSTKAQLTVTINDLDTQATIVTSIIGFKESSSDPRLVFDEFVPRQINKHIKQGERLQIEHFNRGITLKFEVCVTSIKKRDGCTYFITSCPNVIHETQLRSAYRANVSRYARVPVAIFSSNRPAIKGYVEDMSINGLGITLKTYTPNPFHNGEIINACYITVKGNKTFQCEIEVKQFKASHKTKSYYIGAVFISFRDQGKEIIERLVMEMQREECAERDRRR